MMRSIISPLQKGFGKYLSYRKLVEISSKIGVPIAPPLNAYMNVTLQCNSRCTYCDIWKIPNKPNDVSLDQLNKILPPLKKLGAMILTLGGGEPLLRDDLKEMISLAKFHQMSVNIPTNGILLTKERAVSLAKSGVNVIILSLDTSDPKVYQKHRGVPFKVAERALASLLHAANKYPYLTAAVCCVITDYNIDNLVSFTHWILKQGKGKVSLTFQPYHCPSHQGKWENNEFIPKLHRKAILEKQIDKLVDMKKLGAPINNSEFYLRQIPDFLCTHKFPDGFRCLAGYTGIVIAADLKVLPCWRLQPLGDLHSADIVNIWFSRAYRRQRKNMKYLRCPRCWLTCHNEKGWYEWYDRIYKSKEIYRKLVQQSRLKASRSTSP